MGVLPKSNPTIIIPQIKAGAAIGYPTTPAAGRAERHVHCVALFLNGLIFAYMLRHAPPALHSSCSDGGIA